MKERKEEEENRQIGRSESSKKHRKRGWRKWMREGQASTLDYKHSWQSINKSYHRIQLLLRE
jgi:hypothetical protein